MKLRLGLAVVSALALLAPAAASGQEANPGTEVIGGQPADAGEYPFQVALLHRGITSPWSAQFCGGTLISPDTVLTAGHCVEGQRARDVDVWAGSIWLNPGGGVRVPARRLRLHPAYDDETLSNDIAVIQLGTELPFEPIDPVQPGEEALWTPGTVATTIGWGDIDIRPNVQTYPHRLYEAAVPIVTDEDCLQAYPEVMSADQMVCAGDLVDGGEDSCYGDSGGPLMVYDTDRWVQVGVVSTGQGCARRRFPGIYSEVAFHRGFIEPYLDPDSAPDPVRRLRSRRATATSAQILWDEPAFDGGTAITEYEIEVPDLGRLRTIPGSQRFVRIRGLPPGHHRVWVRAVNAIGESASRQTFADL